MGAFAFPGGWVVPIAFALELMATSSFGPMTRSSSRLTLAYGPLFLMGAGLLLCFWCLTEWFKEAPPAAVGAATGPVSGLGGITPLVGLVDVEGEILIGVISSILCFFALRIMAAVQFKDVLESVKIHGAGRTLGALVGEIPAAKPFAPSDDFRCSAKSMEDSGQDGIFSSPS